MGGAQLGSRRRASVVGAIMLSAFSFDTTENLPIGLLELTASDLRVSLSSLGVPVVVRATALLALYVAGGNQVVTGVAIALPGAAAGPILMATQSRVTRIAPGRTEIALAANGAAFNIGVALGALCGGLSLRAFDVRATFLIGGLLTVAALVVFFGENLFPVRGAAVQERAGKPAGVLCAER